MPPKPRTPNGPNRANPPRPGTVYHREDGITADDRCHRPQLQIPRVEPPPGERSDVLALVWFYWYEQGVIAPTGDEARSQFLRDIFGDSRL